MDINVDNDDIIYRSNEMDHKFDGTHFKLKDSKKVGQKRAIAKKEEAERLKKRLNELGVDIQHTQALEGVAAIAGWTSWNGYQSSLGFLETVPTPKHYWLAFRPGEGKTSAIKLYVKEYCKSEQDSVLWIDLGGCEHVPGFKCCEIRYDHRGRIEIDEIPATDDSRVLVRFKRMDSAGGFGGGISKAFCNFVFVLNNQFPLRFRRDLGLVVIDEFQSIGLMADTVYSIMLPLLAGEKARLIVASQIPKSRLPLCPLNFNLVGSKAFDALIMSGSTVGDFPYVVDMDDLLTDTQQDDFQMALLVVLRSMMRLDDKESVALRSRRYRRYWNSLQALIKAEDARLAKLAGKERDTQSTEPALAV